MSPQTRNRLRFILDKPDGISLNIDALRRIDANQPKSESWILRGLLRSIFEEER